MIQIQQLSRETSTQQIYFAELYAQQYASIYCYLDYRMRDPACADNLVVHTFELTRSYKQILKQVQSTWSYGKKTVKSRDQFLTQGSIRL